MFNNLPQNISTYGADIDGILYLIYAIVGFFFVTMEGYLVYAVVRYRRREGVRAVYQTGETWREMRWVVGLVAVVVFLDFLIDFRGADTWAKVKQDFPSGDVEILVKAKQFAWTFVYPGADGQFDTKDDLTVPRILHVPVHRKIRLTLTSEDVIHSFCLPEVRLKQDILPGRRTPAWFEVTRTGTFSLVCAELCGLGHTKMLGVLEVHDDSGYERWLAETAKEMFE
ncbi:MAG: cytochrome c oxidase subunit II [Candidatus Lindowbacteria bacterium RIFCSPLOWO2_12_FULL_62_27]|nr:MAG: cytochrome c oxidase subunit II [Candidatus Lindowbacteria bacterium RIFCSPLOWO2_12_FULL_62_27]OGH63545.1 MAG: cytochrome c oxidase subunit II [Candidatus Lindowbacteria bacterium RIFCSPLOWO2_02_FULL_62_12]